MLKAYKLSCVDDDHGAVIRFAESAKLARKNCGGPERCDCEYINRFVHRAKEFDDASNPVTIEEYLARGWFWLCQNCDNTIYEDESAIIIHGESDHVFCSEECLRKLLAWFSDKDVSKCHESMQSTHRDLTAYLAALGVDANKKVGV